jgi:modulator of FtsH protease
VIGMLVLGLLTRLGLIGGNVDPETARRALEAWHDFYLLSGTAAATLAGLLFVSLSFNLEHLLHESRTHLMRFARNTMLVYLMVLILSLLMLVPHMPVGVIVLQIVLLGFMLGGLSVLALVGWVRRDDTTFSRRHRLRRSLPPIAASLLMVNAARGFGTGEIDGLFLMSPAVCLLLAGAVWSSWDLLVGVARARRGEATHG